MITVAPLKEKGNQTDLNSPSYNVEHNSKLTSLCQAKWFTLPKLTLVSKVLSN